MLTRGSLYFLLLEQKSHTPLAHRSVAFLLSIGWHLAFAIERHTPGRPLPALFIRLSEDPGDDLAVALDRDHPLVDTRDKCPRNPDGHVDSLV